MMNAEQLIEFAAQPTRILFAVQGIIYRPMFHYIRDNGSHGIFTVPAVLSEENKDLWAIYARGVFLAEHAVAYVMINEAWIVERPNDEEVQKTVALGIANAPDRKEVIAFLAEDAEGVRNGLIPIIRTANGEPTLGPLEILERSPRAEGRFIGLLPSRVANA